MEPTSALDQLADIHLPSEVSIWPLAIGYWLLLGTCALLILLAFFIYKKRQKNLYKINATKSLDEIYKNYLHHKDGGIFLQETNSLLKRIAKHAGASPAVLSQPNQQFFIWLKDTSPASSSCFSPETQELISKSLYQKQPEGDFSAFYQLAKSWLNFHDRALIKKISMPNIINSASEANHA